MDKISKEQRSRNMAAIRSIGNLTTEAEFVKLLRMHKITGWRRHPKETYGSPDFLFPKEKIALFVDGCFWHGCKKHYIIPKSNKRYWKQKIERNKARDLTVSVFYKDKGWKMFRTWEHNIKRNPNGIIRKLKNLLAGRH